MPMWNDARRDEQDLYVTLLWEDGHSENAIARFLRTTKNTIVRRRHSLGLVCGIRVAKQLVEPDRFQDLLELHAMREIEEKEAKVTCISPIGTCKWPLAEMVSQKKLNLCGKPVVPGHKLCEKHLAVARK